MQKATARQSTRRRRTNGEGTIYQLPDGRWRAETNWIDPTSGRMVRKTASAKTRREAAAKLAAIIRQRTDGIDVRSSTVTTGAFVEDWLTRLRNRVRPSTYNYHELSVRTRILPMLGRIPLSKLDPDDVERMTDEIVARGRSPQTARHARATLRLALADARAKRLIPDNAASLARPPILEEKEMEFLTVVEVRALLAACEDDEHVGAIVTLAVMTGMRQGEILGATWSDINLDNDTIRVRQQLVQDEDGAFVLGPTKTAKSRRTVSLPAPAAAALRRERARQDERRRLAGSAWQGADDLAFTDELGRPLKRWNVSDDFNELLARGGLRRVRFHDLRHTAASQMLAAGTPLQEVSRVLGHSTIVMMNRYAHFEPEQLRAAASNYERLLSGGV